MSDREDLLGHINDKAVVRGKVTLSSGREADYYVDLRRVTLDGGSAPLVGRAMLDATAGLEYDAVGGLTLGAETLPNVSVSHSVGRRLGHRDGCR